MKWLDFVLRQKEIIRLFRTNKDVTIYDTESDIQFFKFESTFDFKLVAQISKYALIDGSISENLRFSYPVFFPKGKKKFNNAIVLLHGLNERNWDKYLCWAEYLAVQTGKPVILFPLAYHMNRSPVLWSDPRSMSLLVRKRQDAKLESRSLCFANVALSERLSEDPVRFYTSGRQTIEDLHKLAGILNRGEHPMFEKESKLDFFAYSIGSFLAEIVLMINPEHLFDRSKLFVFCGGSIFKSMSGESKFIMDKPAFENLLDYFLNRWWSVPAAQSDEVAKNAFSSMIVPEFEQENREGFFSRLGNRISGISLKKDEVMPYEGVEACMGSQNAENRFRVMDFPYSYSHEVPFPSGDRVEPSLLNESFNRVFSQAAQFLA
jgi:hypothetical protein